MSGVAFRAVDTAGSGTATEGYFTLVNFSADLSRGRLSIFDARFIGNGTRVNISGTSSVYVQNSLFEFIQAGLAKTLSPSVIGAS